MGVELAVCQNSILLFVYIIESYLKMTKFLIILIKSQTLWRAVTAEDWGLPTMGIKKNVTFNRHKWLHNLPLSLKFIFLTLVVTGIKF